MEHVTNATDKKTRLDAPVPEGFGFGKGDKTELALVEQRSDFGEFGLECWLVDHPSKPAIGSQKYDISFCAFT